MTIGEIKRLLEQLKKEDPKGNKELIEYYERAIPKATAKALPKAMIKHLK